MNKQELLRVLRECLLGEVPEQELNNTLRYYEEYLVDEAEKSLEDKIRELGEPRLIAKTIIDTYMVNREEINQNAYKRNYEDTYEEKNRAEEARRSNIKIYSWDTMPWYQKLIALIIGCVIIAVLVGVFVLGVNIFFSFVLPVLMILFAAKMLMKLFR